MNRSVGGSTANSAQIVQMMITAATANFGKESTPGILYSSLKRYWPAWIKNSPIKNDETGNRYLLIRSGQTGNLFPVILPIFRFHKLAEYIIIYNTEYA
jgi:hypothetical protein